MMDGEDEEMEKADANAMEQDLDILLSETDVGDDPAIFMHLKSLWMMIG
jgi:hypothetical protein